MIIAMRTDQALHRISNKEYLFEHDGLKVSTNVPQKPFNPTHVD
jgi:hypothetical protein